MSARSPRVSPRRRRPLALLRRRRRPGPAAQGLACLLAVQVALAGCGGGSGGGGGAASSRTASPLEGAPPSAPDTPAEADDQASHESPVTSTGAFVHRIPLEV